MILASIAVGWGVAASRLGHRRWATTGFGLALLFDLASLNLVWDIGHHMGIGVDELGYTTLVYAMIVGVGLAIVIAGVTSIVGLVQVFGGHANPSTRYHALAASIGQHFAGVVWLVPFVAIFLKK